MSDNDSTNNGLTIGGGFGSGSWDSDSLKPSLDSGDSTGENVVNCYFPVEVVWCGTSEVSPVDRETIQAGIIQDLYDAINRRLA
jgi:hypothetical protein